MKTEIYLSIVKIVYCLETFMYSTDDNTGLYPHDFNVYNMGDRNLFHYCPRLPLTSLACVVIMLHLLMGCSIKLSFEMNFFYVKERRMCLKTGQMETILVLTFLSIY